MNDISPQPASLFKRFAAIVYDLFLLAALLFIAEILIVALNHGEAIPADNLLAVFLHRFYLLLVCYGFFGWFWTRSGQTLGMRTWHLRVENENGAAINWQQAGIRFLVSLISWLALGLGFFWSLFDKQKRTWHDMASHTRLVQLPRN
jgi:uncharacterized RDD family membrane protein YckC